MKKAVPAVETADQVNVANETYTDLEVNAEDWDYDVLKMLANTNNSDFNKLKLCEELAELSEVLIKSHTKHPDNKPPMEKIVEELGDVSIRMAIFALEHGIESQIEDRIFSKLERLLEYVKAGKYKGGV